MVTFYNADGVAYETDDPAEIVRLDASRHHNRTKDGPKKVEDAQFHPADRPVEEVKAYMEKHPEDALRIVAEEKAGKGRKTITEV